MPNDQTDTLNRTEAADRRTWRAWLAEHHRTAPGVWLVYYKKGSGRPSVTYDEAVEEALCFGWIDSKPNSLDDARYMQLFSPRKAKSPWSRLNKQRVDRLIADGVMAPAGLDAIERAKRDGSWSAYDAIEDLTVPLDLATALAGEPLAEQHFTAFSSSVKKQLLWWIESAKRPETRVTRIAEVVRSAAQNVNPLHYVPKAKRQATTEAES